MKQTIAAILWLCAAPALSAQAAAGDAIPAPPLLELRILAEPGYGTDGIDLALDVHEQRLRAWLETGDNRRVVRDDPQAIRRFHALPASSGGPVNAHVRWYPHVMRRSGEDRGPPSLAGTGDATVVPLWSGEEEPDGQDATRRVELVAVNMHAKSFSATDLDPTRVRAGTSPSTGQPAVFYAVKEDQREAYADWTERHIGDACAIVVRGEVRAAPVLHSRIVGQGAITGGLSEQEAKELARALIDAARPTGAADSDETLVAADAGGPVPAGTDPADLAAMQGAQAMLEAEKKLRDMIKAGKISGIDRILTFDEIASWPYEDGLLGMPERVKKLDGQNVLMTGFMLPIDEVEHIKEFLLVQSLWSCCYGQPPDINGFVRVVMKGDARIDYQFEPIKVTGTFKVGATLEDGYCVDVYQLRADAVEVIK